MLSDAEVAEVFVAKWRAVTTGFVEGGTRLVGATPLLGRYYSQQIAANETPNTAYCVFNIASSLVAVDCDGPPTLSRYRYTISVRINGDIETLAISNNDPYRLEKLLHSSPWPWADGYEWPSNVSFFAPAVRVSAAVEISPLLRNANDVLITSFAIQFVLGFTE